MAAIANAFDLLRSSEQTAPSKPKKKKSKAKAKPAEDEAPAVAGESPVVAQTDVQEVVELAEAVPILEKSARTQGPNRNKLWKDWLRQVNDRSPKALKYRTPDGSIIQFKELVLRSRALEIAVEGCITAPLKPEEAGSLAQLLAAFLPRTVDPDSLAAAVGRLGQLLAEDAQSYDTLGAAQRAAHTVVSSLKGAAAAAAAGGAGGGKDGGAVARPATLQERLGRIEREAGKQHGFLASVEKLAATAAAALAAAGDAGKQQRAATSSGISKAHVESASELVKLYGEKFDLLQGKGSSGGPANGRAASGAAAPAIKCLEELKAVISNHLKEASAVEESVKGVGTSPEAKRAQAVASLRREEAVLAQQASELAGKIRLLESQLAQLRSQAGEVEDKRARLQQQQAAALERLGAATGRKMPGLSARHYNDELAAADQLLSLVDPSHCPADGDSLAAAQAEHGNAAEQYMASLRNLMHMASSNMADVPSKVEFVRQRIMQAEKLASLGGLGKEKSTKTREEAQRLLDDTMRSVGQVLREAQGALAGMRARYPSFTPGQQAGLTQAAYEIEDLAAFITRQHDLALAAVRGTAPPPAAAAAPGAAAAAAPRAPPAPVSSVIDGTALPPGGVRPPYGANLGPIQPPAAAAAAGPKGAVAAPPPAAAPKGPVPASNGSSAPAPVASVGADGFKPVTGGKKNRRKA